MQGEKIASQPIETNKSIFVYNGNIFKGIPEDSGKYSDSLRLVRLLEDTQDIFRVLSNLEGPYSFIYFNKEKTTLYFGRDLFGRMSLLIGKNKTSVVLTSVAKKGLEHNFMELPSIGIFCWDINSDKICLLPYTYRNPNFKEKVEELQHFLQKAIEINDNVELNLPLQYFEPQTCHLKFLSLVQNLNDDTCFSILLNEQNWMNKVLQLEKLLELSLRRRINTQPKYCKDCIRGLNNCTHSLVGILFSGGVDCAVLAVLSDRIIDKNHPIDLMNVAFNEADNYDSPDRQTGLQTLSELRQICPDRDWKFLEINISQEELDEKRKSHIADLIFPLRTVLDDSLGCALWFASRGSTDTYTSPCRVSEIFNYSFSSE